MAGDIKKRSMDLLTPVYNILDLTPRDARNGMRRSITALRETYMA
jgi:hypothetical protein